MIFIPEMYKDTKAFVKKHKTLTACGVGIGVGMVLSRDAKTVRCLTKEVANLTKELTFAQGDRRLLSEEHKDLCMFIEEKDLREEFFAFAERISGVEYVKVPR